ncbi:MAG: tetratricopeptide repeat protein [Proteobacteria bacterium]|nr:tetratricopeptide repeat protein [Pseudomonadota bacterium]MBU1612174.1 tetratricopeptide repeat protein [Pseudomonadota bacterium]
MALKRSSKAYRLFRHILIVSGVDVHARRDQASMATFAPDAVTIIESGAEAVDYLNDHPIDLVLCDSELADMDGIKFVQILKRNMSQKMLPVIMITLENRKQYVLDAIAAGCVGYVLRPYVVDTLEKYIVSTKEINTYPEIEELQLAEAKDLVSRGNFDEAIDTFEEILSIQEEAQKYYDMGCDFLLKEFYGKAIIAFKKAVKINDLFAEAYSGLAEAYKGKGDDEAYARFMHKASEVFAQFDRMEEAKSAFIEVLKYEQDVPNPYNSLGVKLRKQGDYRGAIHAYERALELTPEDENVFYNLSKAFYFMGDIDLAGNAVTSALNLNSNFPEAEKLYTRIFNNQFIPTQQPRATAHETKQSSAKDI